MDIWHFDSVECVLIIGLSDMSKNVGGEIEIVNAPHAEKLIDQARRGEIPESQLLRVPKLKPGEAVFMRGSRLLHRVTPLLSGETRITMINSYHPVEPSIKDSTAYSTFKNETDSHAAYEFALHKAWRAHEQLSSFCHGTSSDCPPLESEIISNLQCISSEINDCIRTLMGTLKEGRKY